MAHQETSKHCKRCARHVLARRPGPAHVLHLVLSVITGGLWLPVWLLSCLRFGGWRCGACGARV